MNRLIKKADKTYEVYKVSNNYYVEIENTIEDNKKWIEVWLYKENTAIKMFMFGIEKTEDYLDIIERNVFDYMFIYEKECIENEK